MAYQSGFRPYLVTIRNKVVATGFGETTQYQDIKTVHAAKTWKHGAKAMQEGALDAYEWSAWLIAVITFNDEVRMATKDRKPIAVTRIPMKDSNETFCRVGFPLKSVEKYIPTRLDFNSEDDKHIVITVALPQPQDGSRITICYGLKKLSGKLYEWLEVYLPKNQTSQLNLQTVKDAIIGDINARTTERIISGFDYTVKHGEQAGTQVKVWLSKENQSDFHAMHQQADDLTFPLRYKIGELDDGTPVYEEFADASEMHAICVATTNHVLVCQQAGWAEKDSIDWTPYEELFPEETPTPESEV